MDLSQKVRSICKENYEDNCHNCLLRPKCIAPYMLTMQNHEKWISDINQYAESAES